MPSAAWVEIVVYELPADFDPISTAGFDGAVEVLYARLPGGASSWTPPSESRLARGTSYVWFVRAIFDENGRDLGGASDWSGGRYFKVDEGPTAVDVREALDVLAAFARHGGETDTAIAAALEPDRATTDAARHTDAGSSGAPRNFGIDSVDTGLAAIRGEMPDPTGETYGVAGISNSPSGAGVGAMNTGGGPDLVLDGSADGQANAVVSQSGIDRPSGGIQTFTMTNSGGGTLNLEVDGTVSADTFSGQVPWNNLTQVPVGLDDGDDDTTYTVISPISMTGTTMGLSSTPCGSGGLWRWNGASWVCGQIVGSNIANDAVGPNQMADNAVGSAEIINNSIDGTDIHDGTITHLDLGADSVRLSEIYGDEVWVYTSRPGCGDIVLTLAFQCDTILCSPGPPVPYFYNCSGGCTETAPVTCNNLLAGFMLDPDIP
jgi:hypothetical protein